MTDKAYAVPLHELLAGVPRNARLVIDDPDGMGTQFIPVGRMCHEAAEALRARLAQPEPTIDGWPLWSGLPQTEPKPVAFLSKDRKNYVVVGQPRWDVGIQHWTPLYTEPPKKEWVELTKEECFELCVKHKDAPFSLLLAVQDKSKEKNGY